MGPIELPINWIQSWPKRVFRTSCTRRKRAAPFLLETGLRLIWHSRAYGITNDKMPIP